MTELMYKSDGARIVFWFLLTINKFSYNVEFALRSMTVKGTGRDPANSVLCDAQGANALDNLSQTIWDTFEADRG